MKQLTDNDILKMINEPVVPIDANTATHIRKSLHLSTRIPKTEQNISTHKTIDFHNHTEEEAWQMLIDLMNSDVKTATVITGASGILKPKFEQWAINSVIAPRIISYSPINNGSFFIKLRKKH